MDRKDIFIYDRKTFNMILTDEQQKILDTCDSNIFINAGPGSGKSTLLSLIVSKLIEINNNNFILLLTFTNKASKSIITKCSTNKNNIIGGTFHSVAYKLANKNNITWNICDENKKEVIIKKLFKCKNDKEKNKNIYKLISKEKSSWPINFSEETFLYNSELEKYNMVDFDDILYKFIELIPTMILPPITHIICDETQDTSIVQMQILKVLHEKLNCKMISASDLDQSIYAWRNARPENIQDFIKLFKCDVLNMGYNFRSAKTIVEKSVNLIVNNKQRINKTIRSTKKEDGVVVKYKCNNPIEEINFVINKCFQNRGSKIAILYRNRIYKNHLELELKRNRLKYIVNDMFEITDRSAVKSIMSIVKISTGDYDIYDMEQAVKALKGIGKSTILKLEEECKSKKLTEVVAEWIADPKKQKKFQSILNIKAFYDANQGKKLDNLVRYIETQLIDSFDFQADMKSFILDVTKDYEITNTSIRNLYNDLGLDSREKEQEQNADIELSTIHGFKGAEQDIVILPWTQQFTPKENTELEDERRCFYVAITRAKSKLYMSYSGEEPLFVKEMFKVK